MRQPSAFASLSVERKSNLMNDPAHRNPSTNGSPSVSDDRELQIIMGSIRRKVDKARQEENFAEAHRILDECAGLLRQCWGLLGDKS